MSEVTHWVAGHTAQKTWQLKTGDTAVPLDSATVELILKDRTGATATTTGDVVVVTAATGIVGYTPDVEDLVTSGSPYTATFKATVGGADRFFPEDAALVWIVRDP